MAISVIGRRRTFTTLNVDILTVMIALLLPLVHAVLPTFLITIHFGSIIHCKFLLIPLLVLFICASFKLIYSTVVHRYKSRAIYNTHQTIRRTSSLFLMLSYGAMSLS